MDKPDYTAYNAKCDVEELLTKNRWKRCGKRGDNLDFTRPDKAGGISGNYNEKLRTFYAFSSSAGVPHGVPLSPCALLMHLECGGDQKRLDDRLIELGYTRITEDEVTAAARALAGKTASTWPQVLEVPPAAVARVVTALPDGRCVQRNGRVMCEVHNALESRHCLSLLAAAQRAIQRQGGMG